MFRDYLKSPAGGSISTDNIFILLNEQALSTNFWSKGFKWLDAKKLQKKLPREQKYFSSWMPAAPVNCRVEQKDKIF